MRIGKREFDIYNNTYIMGILNLTPDSFSDGGRFGKGDTDATLKTCEQMISDGADIIDIGGESTRPDAMTVSATEEMERVLPVIEAVAERFDIPISIDTYKAEVASEAIRAGARLVNDIWGLTADDRIAATVACACQVYEGIAVCIMHNRRPADIVTQAAGDVPLTRHGEDTDYGYAGEFMEDVKADLARSISLALRAGIGRDSIILDPGVGFAKTYEQNLTVVKRIKELGHIVSGEGGEDIGFPLLLGCSRKSVIGRALDRAVGERLYGTLATTAYAVLNGVSFIRVHDVAPNADVVRMLNALR